MLSDRPSVSIRLAETENDLIGAQRLRYRVFVEELGGTGPMVDHDQKLEKDHFDPFFDHLVLVDDGRDPDKLDHVVGVYRLMTSEGADRAGQFYSEGEYDLTVLRQGGRKLLELGRSCIDAEYRGGTTLWMLWSGLARYVMEREIEVLFGVASFHGTDVDAWAAPLSLLQNRHLAPQDLRVRAKAPVFQTMDLIPEGRINAAEAMKQVPALIKSYLKLGGFVGEGAFVDHAFNTTDVCLILDVARMSDRQRRMLTEGH